MAKFKTRARAIDLLGRQQIAGIPTAINELFKNAHDAYADYVDVDYFRKEKLFILRDNGLGMTKEDFENRWLVVGTESKYDNQRISPPPIDTSKPLRPIMGEKGIGRLAISAIGKQALILTRAKRDNQLHPIITVLINWGIFEIPGLDLDDVVIPLREFPSDQIPNKSEIESMKTELIDSISTLNKKGILLNEEAIELRAEIDSLSIDLEYLDTELPGNLSLKESSGTQFYISPTDESLDFDIDGNIDEKDTASKLEKFLIGFTNTMTPNHPPPNIEAAFRDYRGEDDIYYELIDKESFFTPEEFKKADHQISGVFDEYGHFSGRVSIYNEHEFEHTIPWAGNHFKTTVCGPFSIEFSYLQGELKQSTLDPITYTRLKSKLNRFGGLYLYKDGIRILPYGDYDYDFLDIEKNRTKSLKYYFFSYRRMFGVINITKKDNPRLIEKSGREGFIENKAYKQIQEILKNFFTQLAGDFFREQQPGVYTEYWLEKRAEIEKVYQAKQKREIRVKERKKELTKNLNNFFSKVQSGEFEKVLIAYLEEADKKFASVASIEDPDEAAQTLINFEIDVRKQISELRENAKVKAPRGFTISKDLRREWEAYRDQYTQIEERFSKAEKQTGELVNKYKNLLHLEISKRKRIEKSLEHISNEAKAITRKKNDEARKITKEITKKIRSLTQELIENLELKIRSAQGDLPSIKLEDTGDTDIYEELQRYELPIVQEQEYASTVLEDIINQLDSIYWEKDEAGRIVTNKDIETSLEEEIGELKEKLVTDVELIQMGLAIKIINHEFSSTVKSFRASLRDLKRWADVDEKFESSYKNIRTNFEHLDGYLSLLIPMDRRLNRKKEIIVSKDLIYFLEDVFRGRLRRHNIQMKNTVRFKTSKIEGYRSVFYPVFVNVVDNAIYWLKQIPKEQERIIIFHADTEGGFYISNNGPEIKIHNQEKIFELGFTTKTTGRGMGLTIAREVLRDQGYDIFVDTPRKDSSVTFKICPQKK